MVIIMKNSEGFHLLESLESEENEALFDIFVALAHKESKKSDQDFIQDTIEDNENEIEMKTTSISMEEPLLASLDVVAKRFDLSRDEALLYAVESFISDAINGYALGLSKYKPNKNDLKPLSVRFFEEQENLIANLDCDDDIQTYITWTTHNKFIKKMKELD